MQFHGLVAKQQVARGSKSEHEAVVLQTAEGPLKLRRVGGNAFSDAVLNQLVGQEISCEGQIHSGQLLITNWQVETKPQ